jgi:hypothetical protein
MKRTFTLASLLMIVSGASAQIVSQQSENDNVRYFVSNNGTFFRDFDNANSGYHIPKDSATSLMYMMSLEAIGEDANGQLKGAASGYELSDFFPGAIADNYTAQTYINKYGDALWTMTQDEIDYHIAHYQDFNYMPALSLLKWPGNGNTQNGEAAMMAPFVDLNSNGIYEPIEGDYPAIRGDKAVYSILNDKANVHPNGTEPVGMEIHLLFYQYLTGPEELINTTFINATIYNRGTLTLYDFHFGAFVDFDLGGYQDDYVGTMIDKNLAYVYNGDLFDGDAPNHQGFGALPPAAGVMSLNGDLYSHVSQANPNQSLPSTATHYYNLLKGTDIYGSPLIDGQSQPTRYAYNGDSTGWTEANPQSGIANAPGDRRSFISMAAETFFPYHQLCYDFAVVYGRSNAGGMFSSVDSLGIVASQIQDFYDQQQFTCASGSVGLNENEELAFTIYPNPAVTELHIDGLQQGDFRILTTDGKTVLDGKFDNELIDINQLHAGYYLLQISHDGNNKTISFVKQ